MWKSKLEKRVKELESKVNVPMVSSINLQISHNRRINKNG